MSEQEQNRRAYYARMLYILKSVYRDPLGMGGRDAMLAVIEIEKPKPDDDPDDNPDPDDLKAA